MDNPGVSKHNGGFFDIVKNYYGKGLGGCFNSLLILIFNGTTTLKSTGVGVEDSIHLYQSHVVHLNDQCIY